MSSSSLLAPIVFVLLCHFSPLVFFHRYWGGFDMSVGPDDEADHL